MKASGENIARARRLCCDEGLFADYPGLSGEYLSGSIALALQEAEERGREAERAVILEHLEAELYLYETPNLVLRDCIERIRARSTRVEGM